MFGHGARSTTEFDYRFTPKTSRGFKVVLWQGPSIELNFYWFYEYLPQCRDVKNRAVWLKKAKPRWKISERRPTQECRTTFPLILPYFFSIPLTDTELRVWLPVFYETVKFPKNSQKKKHKKTVNYR
jgi:hypothetical protein